MELRPAALTRLTSARASRRRAYGPPRGAAEARAQAALQAAKVAEQTAEAAWASKLKTAQAATQAAGAVLRESVRRVGRGIVRRAQGAMSEGPQRGEQ